MSGTSGRVTEFVSSTGAITCLDIKNIYCAENNCWFGSPCLTLLGCPQHDVNSRFTKRMGSDFFRSYLDSHMSIGTITTPLHTCRIEIASSMIRHWKKN